MNGEKWKKRTQEMCEQVSQVKSTNLNVLCSRTGNKNKRDKHREILRHYQLSDLRKNKNKTFLSSTWCFFLLCLCEWPGKCGLFV